MEMCETNTSKLWVGNTFIGDGRYRGDGGRLLEQLWLLDRAALTRISRCARWQVCAHGVFLVLFLSHVDILLSLFRDNICRESENKSPFYSRQRSLSTATGGDTEPVRPVPSSSPEKGVADDWPHTRPPWLPLRKCDGRYSLGRLWADRLGVVHPAELVNGVCCAAYPCNDDDDDGGHDGGDDHDDHNGDDSCADHQTVTESASCAGCDIKESRPIQHAVDTSDSPLQATLPDGGNDHCTDPSTDPLMLQETQEGCGALGPVRENAQTAKKPPWVMSALSSKADPVVVVRLRGGGGLLSYHKPGGRFVHTFNTESGLCRKVKHNHSCFQSRSCVC